MYGVSGIIADGEGIMLSGSQSHGAGDQAEFGKIAQAIFWITLAKNITGSFGLLDELGNRN